MPSTGNSTALPVAFLQLVRWPNLAIVVFTMALLRHGLMAPMLAVNGQTLQMPESSFWILVLSVVLITAAGNMINDYFDVEADRVNRPGKVLAGTRFSEDVLMNLYLAFNAGAILCAFYLAWEIDLWSLALIHLIAAGMLWFYSSAFKRMPVVGNLLVALLSGLVPFLAGLYEWMYEARNLGEYWFNFQFIWGYAVFAVLLSWIREMVKDMQDYKGDFAAGFDTLPVVAGIKTTRWITLLLVLAMMAGLAYIMQMQHAAKDRLSFYYFLFLLQIPLLALFLRIIRAKDKDGFQKASTWCKGIMVLGLLYTGVIWHSLQP